MMDEGAEIEFVIPEGITKTRADKVLSDNFSRWSRVQLQKIFDEGQVQLNGRPIKKNVRVNAGDVLFLKAPVHAETEVKSIEAPLSVLYEDEDIIVVNKAAGMVTHPGANTPEPTLVHALLFHTQGKLSPAGGYNRPGVVHRLDKDTSGLIMFAKSDTAYYKMVSEFSERNVHKEYLALSIKTPRLDSGSIKEHIDRHPINRRKMRVHESGRFAHTDWKVLERFGDKYSLIHCNIHTGRTHQIRVHLQHIGHSIFGDRTYGYRPRPHDGEPPERVFLHARHLNFKHPISAEELSFEAPLPPEFIERLAYFREQFGSDTKTQITH